MLNQEVYQMTRKLQDRDIGIEIHPVDAFTLESNMAVEYSIDIWHSYLL